MADLKHLEALRALGVKRALMREDGNVVEVEFFEPATPSPFAALDMDTLVPPPPDAAADTEPPPAPRRAAPALARVLKNGSVS